MISIGPVDGCGTALLLNVCGVKYEPLIAGLLAKFNEMYDVWVWRFFADSAEWDGLSLPHDRGSWVPTFQLTYPLIFLFGKFVQVFSWNLIIDECCLTYTGAGLSVSLEGLDLINMGVQAVTPQVWATACAGWDAGSPDRWESSSTWHQEACRCRCRFFFLEKEQEKEREHYMCRYRPLICIVASIP